MSLSEPCDGRIEYDFAAFCADHGHPAGRRFTVEVTRDAVTYVYADIMAMIWGDEVVFDLYLEDLVVTRKAN